LGGATKTVAYSLLRVPECPGAEDVRRFEAVIPFVRLASGVHRTTRRGRFDDLNTWLCKALLAYMRPSAALEVHDWAVSDALATVEWAQGLFACFSAARVVGSDCFFHLIEVRIREHEIFIFEPDGTPLQFVRPPFVISLAHDERWFYPINRLVRHTALRKANHIRPWIREHGIHFLSDTPMWREGQRAFRALPLLHPEALQFASREQRFSLAIHDAFTPLTQPCDVLRVMNLYNPGILGKHAVLRGIQSAMQSVRDGGLLLIGRTSKNNRNDASLFRKRAEKLELISRFGNIWELEELATRQVADCPAKGCVV
jgi:hypothetical protein